MVIVRHARVLILIVLVSGLGGCKDEVLRPPQSGPATYDETPPVEVPGSFLDPGGARPTGTPIAERTITIGASEGTDGTLEAMLWNPGDVNGPMVVEVTSELGLTGQAPFLPAADPINYSLLLWWDIVGVVYAPGVPAGAPTDQPLDVEILLGRYLSLQFFSVGSDGSRVRDTTFVPDNGTTVELLDSTAAVHGLGMQWEYPPYQGTSYGDHPPNPLCLDPTMRCVPLPSPDSPGRFGPGPPTGTLIVRVYHAVGHPCTSGDLKITKAAGPNAGGSFTTEDEPDERTITLQADASGGCAALANGIRWQVIDAPYDEVPSIPPDPASLAQGPSITWQVPAQDANRWKAVPHPGVLSKKSLAFEVTASVTDPTGATITSAPDTVKQDEIDTIREEYLELHQRRVPGYGEFSPEPSTDPGVNTGDYAYMVFNNDFAVALNGLKDLWWDRWQVNSIYRNPVHQIVHIRQTGNSAHEYHCAADLQTFPARERVGGVLVFRSAADSLAALAFWDRLAEVADGTGLIVEREALSGVGHVHVERRGC